MSPHLVAATLKFGPVPLGPTLMHDCDVRICVTTGPGHVRVATQGENMRRGKRRVRGPGLVDVRGNVGALADNPGGPAHPGRRRQFAGPASGCWLGPCPPVIHCGGVEGLFDLWSRRGNPADSGAPRPVDLLELKAYSTPTPGRLDEPSWPMFDLYT